ncbi:MAG: hypothetical protein VX619_04225, partial [bacterium]|nr:hypothetical protein [bacterium]
MMSVEVLDQSELPTPLQIASKVLEMSHSDIPRPRKMRILMGYANHPHDRVRASALNSLAVVISPELGSFYLPYLSDLSLEVRSNAINYLASDSITAQAYSEEILESMNGLIQNQSETAHKILLECLSKLNRTEYANQLVELVQCATYDIQQEALALLKNWAKQSPELIDLVNKTEKLIEAYNSSSSKRIQSETLPESEEIFIDAQSFLKELRSVLSRSNKSSKKALLRQVQNYEVILDESDLFEILNSQLKNEKDIDCLALVIDITKQLSGIDHWEVLSPFLQNENSKIVNACVGVLSERNDMRILPILMDVINDVPLYASKINTIMHGISILKKKRPDIAVTAVEKIIKSDIENSDSIVNKILKDWITPPADLSAALIRCYLNQPNQKLHDVMYSYLEYHSTPWDLVLIDNLLHLARESE